MLGSDRAMAYFYCEINHTSPNGNKTSINILPHLIVFFVNEIQSGNLSQLSTVVRVTIKILYAIFETDTKIYSGLS